MVVAQQSAEAFVAVDRAGNLLRRTDRDGRVIAFVYDALSRLTEEHWLDAEEEDVDVRFYAYDAAGRLVSAADSDSALAFTYDALGRVTSTDNDGTPDAPHVVLAAAYDALGRRTALSAVVDDTADFTNEYLYDALGRATRITQHGQTGGNTVADKRVDFTYDAAGRYTTVTRFADLPSVLDVAQTQYDYDAAGRLTSLVHAQGTTALAEYEWTYDASGRLTSTTNPDGTTSYTYDATSQLTGADSTGQPDETYAYDANGNRIMSGYSTGADNQVLSDGVSDFEYDDEGNLTAEENISTGARIEYTWDHRNQLARVTFKAANGDPTKVVAYEYDALGRLITKKVDDDADGDWDRGERHIHDASGKRDSNGIGGLDDVVLVYSLSGSLTTRYLHGRRVDEVLAAETPAAGGQPAVVLWALSDNQGTVRDLARRDASTGVTTVTAHRTLGSFGNILTETNPATNAPIAATTPEGQFLYAYTGRHHDRDTNLTYNRARWTRNDGRFLNHDPLGFQAGDPNTYRYVGNSPTNATDPSGAKLVFDWTDRSKKKYESKDDRDAFEASFIQRLKGMAKAGRLCKKIADDLLRGETEYKIVFDVAAEVPYGNSKDRSILLNPDHADDGFIDPDNPRLDPAEIPGPTDRYPDAAFYVIIGHEYGHAGLGLEDPGKRGSQGALVPNGPKGRNGVNHVLEDTVRDEVGLDPRPGYTFKPGTVPRPYGGYTLPDPGKPILPTQSARDQFETLREFYDAPTADELMRDQMKKDMERFRQDQDRTRRQNDEKDLDGLIDRMCRRPLFPRPQ